MKAKAIKDVARYLDGGTTIIQTIDGDTFYCPHPLSYGNEYPLGGPNPTWNKFFLRDLTSSNFEIVETDSVSILSTKE